jgi:hypothetical protein
MKKPGTWLLWVAAIALSLSFASAAEVPFHVAADHCATALAQRLNVQVGAVYRQPTFNRRLADESGPSRELILRAYGDSQRSEPVVCRYDERGEVLSLYWQLLPGDLPPLSLPPSIR